MPWTFLAWRAGSDNGMFLVPRKNAHIDNVWLITSVALHLRVATNKWLKRSFETMDSSEVQF